MRLVNNSQMGLLRLNGLFALPSALRFNDYIDCETREKTFPSALFMEMPVHELNQRYYIFTLPDYNTLRRSVL